MKKVQQSHLTKLLITVSFVIVTFLSIYSQTITDKQFDQWRNNNFEIVAELLEAMPKGGELHSHLSGAIPFEQLYNLASKNNYKAFIDNEDVGFVLPFDARSKIYRPTDFQAKCISQPNKCFELKKLSPDQKNQLKSSVVIDKNDTKSTERDSYESFGKVFNALDDLTDNADMIPELVKLAMIEASNHNLCYIELKLSPYGRSDSNRNQVKIETLLDNISIAIQAQNNRFKATNKREITTRLIAQIDRRNPLRPGGNSDLEPIKCNQDCHLPKRKSYLHSRLRQAYYLASISPYNNLVVGIDFVGLPEAELATKPRLEYLLGSLRAEFGEVNMTVHAGESKRPGWYDHVSEAVQIGADRIGHGVNMVDNMASWDLICEKGIPIEINLSSNVLLGVVESIESHPFPRFFNEQSCAVPKKENDNVTNDPVTLNTDNAGIFQTTMSNEFCIATKTFDLTWEEVKQLARNSLKHNFASRETRRNLLEQWDKEIRLFEQFWQTKNKTVECKVPSLK